ncbi:MAG TPA: PIN domain-containing protein [Longimicrobium sp.]|nr:PIN domain-containing protein [Longimicrobium sp.]
MAPNEVFVDTACVVALLNRRDQHHGAARALFDAVRSQSRLVTTRAVCFEIGDFYSRSGDRGRAAELLQDIDDADDIDVLPVNEDLYSRALQLFSDRPEKEWSLTDCSSFVVMKDRGITAALTTDRHFRQAGFVPLMRSNR